MENKKTAVFGLCATPAGAEHTVDALVNAGFTDNAVSVLMADNQSTRDFAHEKNTKAPEGTATGGVLGGTLGLLAGIGALAGLGVGGAVGGLIRALVGMGIPEYEAKRYEGRL